MTTIHLRSAAVLAAALGILLLAGCQRDDPGAPAPTRTLDQLVDLAAEPEYTPGLSNTLTWSVDGGTTALPAGWSYQAERATTEDFTDDVLASAWVTEQHLTFGALRDGETYYYRVRARDAQGAASGWSAAVRSTQDANVPTASIQTLDEDQKSLMFDLEITADDVGSGLAEVELWFRSNGGERQLYGAVAAGTTSFQATAGGPHEFFVRAVDRAGNRQDFAAAAQAVTEVPEPIIMVDRDGYEWDVTNAVLRHGLHLDAWKFGLGRFTIPAAIDPIMIGPGDIGWPSPDNLADVVGVDVNGDRRAYKIGAMAGREVADDVAGGTPIAVSY